MTPFSLENATKPGHRKILALFLVDPHIKILSTSSVPPQRTDWWAEEVRKVKPFSELPVELFDQIIDQVEDFPINWASACEAREALMAERTGFNEALDELWPEVRRLLALLCGVRSCAYFELGHFLVLRALGSRSL